MSGRTTVLGETIERLTARDERLALFNAEASDDRRERIERFFELHGIEVLDPVEAPDRPRNYATLFDDRGVRAGSPIPALLKYLPADPVPPFGLADAAPGAVPAAAAALEDDLYAAREVSAPLLRTVVGHLGTLAERTGDGTLRVTPPVVENLAPPETLDAAGDAGVDVVVCGPADLVREYDVRTVAFDEPELARLPALAYDGDGRRTRMAALAAEPVEEGATADGESEVGGDGGGGGDETGGSGGTGEGGDGEIGTVYRAFWTIRPELVEEVAGALRAAEPA